MINNKYIELLLQYRSGTISETDRHELERAALDDPFLFDAMEGFAMHGSDADISALAELRTSKQKEQPKVRWLTKRMMGVAASLVAFLAITFIVKNQLTNEPTEQIAVATHEKVSEQITPMAQVYDNGSSQSDEVVQLEQTTIIEEEIEIEEKEFVAVSIGDVNTDDIGMEAPIASTVTMQKDKDVTVDADLDLNEIETNSTTSAQKNEEGEEANAILKEETEETPVVANTKRQKPTETNSRSKKKIAKPAEDAITYDAVNDESQYILGKVLGTDGTELIGVNVYIENTEIGDISDIEGNFKLPKYERGHQMVVSYTGYEDQKIVLGNQNFYQIVLQQKKDLSEVRITRLQVVDKFKAYPAMGMEEFEIYIKDNIKFPLEVFGAAKSKKVKVSFEIDMSGKLSNFIDESKNCDDCFKEAIRLLKDSGRWETKPFGSAYRTSYTFEF